MDELTDLFSGMGWCLFGLAAVLLTIFLLKMIPRFDRIIALAESVSLNKLPALWRKVIDQ